MVTGVSDSRAGCENRNYRWPEWGIILPVTTETKIGVAFLFFALWAIFGGHGTTEDWSKVIVFGSLLLWTLVSALRSRRRSTARKSSPSSDLL